jgi:epoxyqueuosine reductase
MNASELSIYIKNKAHEAGFHKVGIAQANKLPRSEFLKEWLSSNKHGTMQWMENNLEKRLDVCKLYPGAKSVVALGLNYYTPHKHSKNVNHGKISRYAWGKDYHKIIKKKLKFLLNEIKKINPSVDGRLFVDTAPIQDKLWAVEAGLGWQGKHTNIISRNYGSWLFLAELVLNVELQYDQPVEDFCGTCVACIDACPTQALTSYQIDARKCISYMTIELWDKPIPDEFSTKLNNWIFGCDICQEVCPWNRFVQQTDHDEFQPDNGNVNPDLDKLVVMQEDEFKNRFKKTPVSRAKYKNFIRNVHTVIKNRKSQKKGKNIT